MPKTTPHYDSLTQKRAFQYGIKNYFMFQLLNLLSVITDTEQHK